MPHAIGIRNDGIELLVHVGIDTVRLNGDGLALYVRDGDWARAGDVLLAVDRDKLAWSGCPDVVIETIANSEEIERAGGSVEPVVVSSVEVGSPLVQVRW